MTMSPSVPVTPDSELDLIRFSQKREQAWWDDYLTMNTLHDVEEAEKIGYLVRLPGGADYYKMSKYVIEELRVLHPIALAALDNISLHWHACMHEQGIPCDDLFLVVSSLTRTIERQDTLTADGYPTADGISTHCKGGAFDIGVKWYKEFDRMDALRVLDDILGSLHRSGQINWIPEPTIGAYHVAVNPNFKE